MVIELNVPFLLDERRRDGVSGERTRIHLEVRNEITEISVAAHEDSLKAGAPDEKTFEIAAFTTIHHPILLLQFPPCPMMLIIIIPLVSPRSHGPRNLFLPLPGLIKLPRTTIIIHKR